MRKLIYICFLSFSFAILSCDLNDKNEGRFDDANPSSGWVQFRDGSPVTIIYGSQSSIVLPIDLNAPVNKDGIEVTYTITDISGSSTSLIPERTGTVEIFKNDIGEVVLTNNLVIDLPNTGLASSVIFDIELTSTSRTEVAIGLSDNSRPTTVRVQVCPVNIGTIYNATATASTGFEGPDFVQTLVPVAGTTNKYSVDTAWGVTFFPCFIGNCASVGAIRRYPAIITVNDDYTVDVVGNDPAFPNRYPGGEGTYDPCTDSFDLVLRQGLLTSNPFTVNVIYSPQ